MEVLFLFVLFVIIATGFSVLGIKIDTENRETVFLEWKKELVPLYGESTLEIHPNGFMNKYCSVLVFDQIRKIIINQTVYDYSDILDFSVNGQMSYKTSTSTGSMIGRGIVGGVLLGGIGALAGASTGNKHTTSQVGLYTITVNIRNMQHPIEEFKTQSLAIANQFEGVLKIIIDSNQNLEH